MSQVAELLRALLLFSVGCAIVFGVLWAVWKGRDR
jgi:hypothetical protein